MENEEITQVEKQAQADYIKCASCGGNMIFDPESQMLFCEYCGSKVSFEKDKEVAEISIEQAFEAVESWSDVEVLHCENCGADIAVERNEVSLNCPYCGTSHIKRTETIAGIKPNAFFPFTVGKDKAQECAKKWAKGRLFAPKKFKKHLYAENFRGVYQPCFTFDSQTTSSYSGRLGKHKTRTVQTKNGTRTETYTVWYNVRGTLSHLFDDVTVSASSKISQSKLDKIMPFKRETVCVYEKEYLAGFVANHYDKDIKTSWNEAKSIMDKKIRNFIVSKYDCDVVDYLDVSTIHNGVTYKYVLLPLYVLNYGYKKKNYEVTINGNTGKVTGKTPISPLRVCIAIAIGALIIGGIYLISRFT